MIPPLSALGGALNLVEVLWIALGGILFEICRRNFQSLLDAVWRELYITIRIHPGDDIHDWVYSWLLANCQDAFPDAPDPLARQGPQGPHNPNGPRRGDGIDSRWSVIWDRIWPIGNPPRDMDLTSARRKFVRGWNSDDNLGESYHDEAGKLRVVALPAADVSHYCRFKGRTLVMKRYKGGWSYGDALYYISVSAFLGSHALLQDFLNAAQHRGKLRIFSPRSKGYHAGSWGHSASKPGRPWESVVLPENVKEDLLEDATEFLEGEAFYRERGLPYRRGYLLYGVPGSGKTSLVGALAAKLGLNIYWLSLGSEEYSRRLELAEPPELSAEQVHPSHRGHYTATIPLLFYRIADRRSRTWFLIRPALFLAMRLVTLSMRVYMSKASYSVQVLVSEITFVSLGLLLLAESLVALWSRSVDLSSLGLTTNTHKWTRVLTYLLRFLLVAACAMGISAVSELPLSFDDKGNVGKSVYILRVGSYAVSAAIILSLFIAILSSHFTLHVPLLRTTYLLAINFLLACVASYRVAQTFSVNADDAIRKPIWFWTFQMLVEFLAYLLFLLISIPEAFPSSSPIKSIASRSSISVSSIEHEKRFPSSSTKGSGHVDRFGRVVRFLPFTFPSVSSTSDNTANGNGNGNNNHNSSAPGVLSAQVQTHGPGRFTPAPTIGPLQRIWKRKASKLLRLKREEAINEAKAAQAREMGEEGIPRDSHEHEHDAETGEEDITAHSSRALHGAGGAYDPNDLRAIGSPVFVHDDEYEAGIPEGIDPYAASARLGQSIHTGHTGHTGYTNHGGHGFHSHHNSITVPNFSRPGVTGLGVGVTSADATPLEEKRAMDMDVIRSMVLEASIPTPTLSFADLPSASLPLSPSGASGGDFTPSHSSHSHSKSMSRVISHDSEKRFAREAAAEEQALSPRSKPPSLHFPSHHDGVDVESQSNNASANADVVDQGDYATVDPRMLGERLNVWADVERGRAQGEGEGEYEYESAYGYRRPSGAGSLNRMRTLSF